MTTIISNTPPKVELFLLLMNKASLSYVFWGRNIRSSSQIVAQARKHRNAALVDRLFSASNTANLHWPNAFPHAHPSLPETASAIREHLLLLQQLSDRSHRSLHSRHIDIANAYHLAASLDFPKDGHESRHGLLCRESANKCFVLLLFFIRPIKVRQFKLWL